VIVLDDLHCATRLDLELLDHVHRTLGPRGALIVATARLTDASADFAAWRASKGRDLREVPLTGFGEADVKAWLEGAFHGLRVTPIETRQLLRASGGNPFALVEIARQLVSRGELVQRPASAGASSCGRPAAQPASRRGDGGRRGSTSWRRPIRAVLEYAAVLGDEFRAATRGRRRRR
jgi:hypothetical protein